MNNKKTKSLIRLAVSVLIVLAWVWVEFFMGGITRPTLELRIILFTAVVYLFGETTVEFVWDKIRG